MIFLAPHPRSYFHSSGPEVVRERGFGTLVAAGVSVHFLQELAHRIELRAKTFPISGLQSLHGLIVVIKRLPCLTCAGPVEGISCAAPETGGAAPDSMN